MDQMNNQRQPFLILNFFKAFSWGIYTKIGFLFGQFIDIPIDIFTVQSCEWYH